VAHPVAPVSVLQVVVQALAPQMYGAQLWVGGVEQLPVVPPEQKEAGVKTLPVQVAAAQLRLVAAWVQAPEPLQAPVLPQVLVTVQRLCGSVPPPVTLAQVPLPLMLQAWQVPQALVEQHTPSTQKLPLVHSCVVPQVAPGAVCATQVPFDVAVQ